MQGRRSWGAQDGTALRQRAPESPVVLALISVITLKDKCDSSLLTCCWLEPHVGRNHALPGPVALNG